MKIRTIPLPIDLRDTQLFNVLVAACQFNPWLKIGGVDFEDDFCLEEDYPYELRRYEELGELRKFFERGNWGLRYGVVYEDVIFVNQVNGGDEWWTLKVLENGNVLPFESITFGPSIKRGEFPGLIARLVLASPEECKKLTY